jgi:hypothetical protein
MVSPCSMAEMSDSRPISWYGTGKAPVPVTRARPGLTATMLHRSGYNRNNVTLWRLRRMASGDW